MTPPIHPQSRPLHRSSVSTAGEGSFQGQSPLSVSRMSPSLHRLSPSSSVTPRISDFFNNSMISQTQPFFPRSTPTHYHQQNGMGNLSTDGTYSGHSTPNYRMNTMARPFTHYHTHSAGSSSGFEIDHMNTSGRLSYSSGSSNHHRPIQHLVPQQMMPSMGFTPPRPRLVHANSFHFKSTLLEPPAVPLEERAKSPKKMKKKNKKKTKSHGERDLFPHK